MKRGVGGFGLAVNEKDDDDDVGLMGGDLLVGVDSGRSLTKPGLTSTLSSRMTGSQRPTKMRAWHACMD